VASWFAKESDLAPAVLWTIFTCNDGNKDTLAASLERIQHTSAEILTAIMGQINFRLRDVRAQAGVPLDSFHATETPPARFMQELNTVTIAACGRREHLMSREQFQKAWRSSQPRPGRNEMVLGSRAVDAFRGVARLSFEKTV